MRFALCQPNIIEPKSGALNLKYFNEKKGSYWSQRETRTLKRLLTVFRPTEVKKIKNHQEERQVTSQDQEAGEQCLPGEAAEMHAPFENFGENELRLRISKVLKIYDPSKYKTPFTSKAEVEAERKKNYELAK